MQSLLVKLQQRQPERHVIKMVQVASLSKKNYWISQKWSSFAERILGLAKFSTFA
jgi:hypothetical protein